jgi:TonB family protein
MVPFPARRSDDPERLPPDTCSASKIQPKIDELASHFAAQGIQSSELVLDLVLHDFADEARHASDASGAAIALERDGEIVCRAAAGATVPDLGVRIHNKSGLSAVCLKKGTTQLCSDTEADDRVDAEACRHLGVRSIVVIPLLSQDRIIGIFEVFSARPNAFSTEVLQKLESLATAAAQTVRAARGKVVRPAEGTEPTKRQASSDDSAVLSVASIMQKVSPIDPAVKVLRWLVIGLAIPLVVLIGFDWRWHRAHPRIRPAGAAQNEEPRRAEPQTESPPQVAGPSAPAFNPPASRPPKPKVSKTPDSRGGLVVYQNGKVIYREGSGTGQVPPPSRANTGLTNLNAAAPTAETDSGKKPVETPVGSLSPGITGGRLLERVQPKYPAKAIAEKLEGSVNLRGAVGPDGIVRDLKLVHGDPVLGDAAVEAVEQWRYEPYRRNGLPILMPIEITIDFNLSK